MAKEIEFATNALKEMSQYYIGGKIVDWIYDDNNYKKWNTMVVSPNKAFYNQDDSLLISRLSKKYVSELRSWAFIVGEADTYVWADPSKRAYSMRKIIETNRYPKEILEPLICKSWSLSEHTLKSRNSFVKIFEQFKGGDFFEQTKKGLPKHLTVYRAGTEDDGGISWTTDEGVANFFQSRYKSYENVERPITKKQVSRDDIVCFLNYNHESEVVILPEKKTSKQTNTIKTI